MDIIKEKLKLLPDNPGVYIMLDGYGNVIYVGKAKVLKNRVRQYFHNTQKPEKVLQMVANVRDFNYIITNTEIDALALENNLIKKYKPKYNILLKDDKTYPYIKVNLKDDFPTFSVTRKIRKDGAKYFGPFMGGISCKEILDTIQLVYKVRLCSVSITNKAKRECLNNHIERCSAPCAHKVSKEEYFLQVKGALDFLEGNYKNAENILKEKMFAAAENEAFELALDYKNRLATFAKLEEKRITSINRAIDVDVISYCTNNVYSAINVLITRKGIMQGGKSYSLDEASISKEEALTSFIIQYYTTHEAPSEIIADSYCERELLETFFKEKLSKNVTITLAKQGVKSKLLKMAQDNAREYLEKAVDKIKHKDDMTVNACKHLQKILNLSRYPRRMECYDISNVSGVDKVGSMVVFIDGEADKSSYRRFIIKNVEGANDYASHQEMMERRLKKLGGDEEDRFPKPDLIVIDGGKGQLSAVKCVFDKCGVQDIDLISLAEREEEVYTLYNDEPIIIPRDDYSLRMLQRLRDEAHRFAITHFRTMHQKRNLKSVLSEIDGVGKRKAIAIMKNFTTITDVANASEEQLMQIEGIGPALATKIKMFFNEQHEKN